MNQMIKLSLFILFLHTYLLSNINIDIDKKAITIGLSSTLSQAKSIADDLDKYNLYIYKTTSTKKSYYVIYAVNIKKDNQQLVLKNIQKKYKDAYISSDSRVKKLATVNFDKNIFIKSPNHQNNNFVDNTINLNKQSLFVTYVKDKKELFHFIKKNRKYNLFIENIKHNNLENHAYCCAIYIVNINTEEFDNILEVIKNSYSEAKKEQTTFLKYRNERYQFNKFIKSSTKSMN